MHKITTHFVCHSLSICGIMVEKQRKVVVIMKTRENCKKWVRGVALAVALSLAATAAPVLPSQAASKKVTVSVKSPKKGVKLSGSKLTIHKKGKVVLTVKSGKSNVTKKATVKSSNKKVLMFGGGGGNPQEERQDKPYRVLQGRKEEAVSHSGWA